MGLGDAETGGADEGDGDGRAGGAEARRRAEREAVGAVAGRGVVSMS